MQKLGLSIIAKENDISTIPTTIVKATFERASNLVATPGSVILEPGAEYGSFIVAGTYKVGLCHVTGPA